LKYSTYLRSVCFFIKINCEFITDSAPGRCGIEWDIMGLNGIKWDETFDMKDFEDFLGQI